MDINPTLLSFRLLFVLGGVIFTLFWPKIGLVYNWKDRSEWPVLTHIGYWIAGLAMFGFTAYIIADTTGLLDAKVWSGVLKFFGITLP